MKPVRTFVRVCLVLLSLSVAPAPAQLPDSFFGVKMVDVDSDRAARLKLAEERGVEVVSVVDDSPADVAGVRTGDALLTYNGENILGAQQLARLVRETPAGRKVRVQLWRGGKSQTVSVTLAALQPAGRVLPGIAFPDSNAGPITRNAKGGAAIDIPEPSNANQPDIPVMLLVWRSTLLGVECEGIDTELAHYFGVKQGILVRAVERGGPSERAGVKAGDVLVSIADRPLASPRDLNAFHRAFRLEAGRNEAKPLALLLVRDKKNVKVSVAVSFTLPE